MSKRSMLFKWVNSHTSNLIAGGIASVLGYFAPAVGVMAVVSAAILFDLIVGIKAARKRGEGIKSGKLWKTIQKLFYALAVVGMLYAGDVEIGFVPLHKAVAFFIFGFEMWSVLEKIAYLTDYEAFGRLRDMMKDKIKDQTGIDVSENN